MVRMLMWLYPRSWRQRYGEEFEALLDQVDLGWREILDIAGGAGLAHARLHVVGLVQLLALAGFALCEYTAVQRGYTVNLFWAPTEFASLGLLAGAVSTLVIAVGPALAWLVRRVAAPLSRPASGSAAG